MRQGAGTGATGATAEGRRSQANWWGVMVVVWLGLTVGWGAAPAITATLDRDTAFVGESVTLMLTFTGGEPSGVPPPPAVSGLTFQFVGQSSQFSLGGGQTSSSVTYNYQITPSQLGEFTIPPFLVVVDGVSLRTQPLRLKAIKAGEGAGSGLNQRFAFLKLIVPKSRVYLGEVVPIEVRLYVQSAQDLQTPQLRADGFTIGKLAQPIQSQTVIENQAYNQLIYPMSVAAAKTGPVVLGPAELRLTLRVARAAPSRFDPIDFFGGRVELRPATLTSDPQSLVVLPLPAQNVPPGFTGAVGSYRMTVQAGPTNVAVGDPITLRIQITGRGNLDTLALPPLTNWVGFKLYSPSGKVESSDPLGLQGMKTFEQVVAPESPDIKALPPVVFSFFDPDRRSYQTLVQPALPLVVRPGTNPPAGTLAPLNVGESAPLPREMVPIKTRLGRVRSLRPPWVEQGGYWVAMALPVALWLGLLAWRRQQEALARNPRLRRQREVARRVGSGLIELRRLASANEVDPFFALTFHLVQEQLGERLDLPASSITESVIEEHLRPRGVAEATLTQLHDLFQECNQVRYAPRRSLRVLEERLPQIESVLGALRQVPGQPPKGNP